MICHNYFENTFRKLTIRCVYETMASFITVCDILRRKILTDLVILAAYSAHLLRE